MRYERRLVLSLIAMGRISAAEAERLIAAWSAEREVLWIAAAGVALCAAQAILHGQISAIGHLVHALAPGWTAALHGAAATIVNGVGGLS